MIPEVFSTYGNCVFCGTWSTITAARSFNSLFLQSPPPFTHFVRYDTGAVHALVTGELLTGGTSSATARLVGQVIEDGNTAADGDLGVLFLNGVTGTFEAETLTGTSTGTVAIVNAPIDIRNYMLSAPKALVITVETATLNYTIDGSLVTLTAGTNCGHTVAVGGTATITGSRNIRNFSAINAANASGAIMKYSLYY